MMPNDSKIAIITGAGSGIGRAVAIGLNSNGWRVVLAGRRKDALEATARQCAAGQTLVVPTDLTNEQSVRALFEHTKQKFSRLDLLVNNAGITGPPKPMEELSLPEWQNVINTNLTGAFLCTQEAVKMMKHQQPMGGRIINNGSVSAHIPRPNSTPYTVSKHGITGLTKCTSLDGRAFRIACGQIDIGNVASSMTDKMSQGVLQADGTYQTEPTINLKAVSDAVLYMAGLPLDANVPFITVMANQMPYMGRG
jgi:NAD(P)-dependent dehydrogenase (short-subunit alcohol dehydrogenase family)